MASAQTEHGTDIQLSFVNFKISLKVQLLLYYLLMQLKQRAAANTSIACHQKLVTINHLLR